MRYPLYTITATFLLLMMDFSAFSQSHTELLSQMQNRVTISHEDGSKEILGLTQINIKARAEQQYNWYRAQKIHTTQGGYSGKLLEGAYERFLPSKELIVQGNFKKGVKYGLWKIWDVDGNLLKRGKMKNGDWQGKVWAWNEEDHSHQWTYYQEGKLISLEEYRDRNILSRTGGFFNKLWHNVFHPKKTEE